MPKVTNTTIKILGEHVKLDIFYNGKLSFHIPKINPEIVRVTGVRFSHYSTEAELISALENAVREYHKIKTTKKKIIVYSIAATSAIKMNRDGKSRGNFMGYKEWAKDKKISDIKAEFFNYNGYAFGLTYEILFRVDANGAKYYKLDNENLPPGWNDDPELGRETSVDRDCIQIDWTIEREKAIIDICEALERMAERAITILSDAEKTIQLLESNVKLLS